MVCGNFILPEPASYVFFYALFNLRKLLYIIFPKGWFIKRFVLKSKWSMVLRFQSDIDRLFYKLNLPGCMEIKF